MNNISLFRPNDPYELLISQMIAIERQPQDLIKKDLAQQERMKRVLSDLDSKVSSLHTLVKKFTDTLSTTFQGRSATVPETKAFGVSTTSKAALGTHTLDVTRLATTDTRISKQFSDAGTSLRSFFDTNGAQSFQVGVASPTEADPDNVAMIDVTIDPTGATDDEILAEISTAINNAMSDAADAETISKSDKAFASIVNETTDTARLSLRSGKTGFSNRLRFTDSANGLLSLLETTNNSVASGTGGGQVTSVGTSETDSGLNASFVLDGLTLYRSTNDVSDALTGVSLKLKKTGEGPVEFSVGSDAESIKTEVNDFIKKYNDLLGYIEGKSRIDADLGIRGDFAGDSSVRSLRFGLRNDVTAAVTGQPSDAPTSITDLGITINDDGTLVLDDADKLISVVEKSADSVESLFSGANGIATRVKARVDQYTGVNSILDNRMDSSDDRITRLNKRIKNWDSRLQQREDQLRKQFASLQESLALFQGQQQNINMYMYSNMGMY